MRALCLAAFALLPPAVLAAEAAAPALPVRPDVTVGIVDYTSPSHNELIIPATLQALRKSLGPEHVQVKRYSLSELASAIRKNEVDVFLASSGFCRTMVPYGASALATVASVENPDPNQNDGSAFVVRSDSPVRTLMDASGKRLGASSPNAFLGYLVGLGEVARQGGSPDRFFSETRFYGGGPGAGSILEALRRGEVDIGIFRQCWLEDHERANPADRGLFRVVDPRPDSGRCLRSSNLYPTWTISTAPGIRPDTSKLVASAVLDMPPTRGGLYWSIATDFRQVDDLYRTLRRGPYAYLREWSVKRFLAAFWPGIVIALLLVAGLAAHALRTEVLVKRRTAQLQEALRVQKNYQARARAANEKIRTMEKIGIVGELCSVFAHEMRQPLGAIALYAQGLRSLVRRGSATPGQLSLALERIETQTRRASDIVERVRAYARSRSSRRESFFLNDALSRAQANFEASSTLHPRITRTDTGRIAFTGDPLEMELVAYNLIKNAAEAVRGQPDGAVEILLTQNATHALLSVSDNGPALSREELERLANPGESLKSGKAEGLGLGLLIVKAIIEKNGGRLSYESSGSRGVTAWVFLPLEKAGRGLGNAAQDKELT